MNDSYVFQPSREKGLIARSAVFVLRAVAPANVRRFGIAVLVVTTILIVAAASSAQEHAGNLISNPSFESEMEVPVGWETFAPVGSSLTRDRTVSRSGAASARIEVHPEGASEYPAFKYPLRSISPGEEYEGRVWTRTRGMKWAWGAYVVLEFFEGDRRLCFAQGEYSGAGDTDWLELKVVGRVPARSDCMKIALVTHGEGTAWFDDVQLHRTRAQDEFKGDMVELRANPERILCDRFLGFGAHGDFFLTCAVNKDHGVKDDDVALVQRRVEEMRPHILRTFFAYQWWEPEPEQFTPDSEHMRDYVTWLRFLQRIGTQVLLTPWGDYFAYSPWMISEDKDSTSSKPPKLPAPGKREAVVRSLVHLLEYLRRDQGLDNLAYLCLMNEPDNDGDRPVAVSDFAAMYRMLDGALRKCGLRNGIKLLGPDESGGPLTGVGDWYRRTIPELVDVFDGISCHTYQHQDVPMLVPWIDRRLETLGRLNKPKPFLITEFGYGGDTYKNPGNGTYEYGLFMADFAVTALREGTASVLTWCLFDTYYTPKDKQEYGLWRFADDGWRPRPGFYSWSLITRYTRRDSKVITVESKPNTESLRAVALVSPQNERTFLIVNRYDKPVKIKLVTGLQPEAELQRYDYTRTVVASAAFSMLNMSGVLRASVSGSVEFDLASDSFVLLTDTDLH